MPQPLVDAIAILRSCLLDADSLVRAVAAGRRKGHELTVRRAELRPVTIKGRGALQIVRQGERDVETVNYDVAEQLARGNNSAMATAIDELLAMPFGNWHVETASEVLQLRVTKKGEAQLHRAPTSGRSIVVRDHDRTKNRLMDSDDPLFDVLGADADKRRQVDAFLRILKPATAGLLEADPTGSVGSNEADPAAAPTRPLRVVDLGCGNAYLTFAAHRWLTTQGAQVGRAVETVGIELRPDLIERSRVRAQEAGLTGMSFEEATIANANPFADGPATARPDIVLALHACDTATDEALARAIEWQSPVILVAPCCHHDISSQLASSSASPSPYGSLIRHAILKERFADVLTDALRALLLRINGYKVDVIEFVDSRHTPRNAMIRAVRIEGEREAPARFREEYEQLVKQWQVTPALAKMLDADRALTAPLPRR